jgi:CubicO group peptidase (beta-lactamase class C family)
MVTRPLLLAGVLLTIACGSIPAAGRAAEPSSGAIAATVDALFAEWARPDSPGCAVAVVREDRILHAKGYGMADLEHDVPITPRTVFYIGSVGKQFTAYAVVQLSQQGKLALDDEVRKYVPELHDFGRTVTIRRLIHHTSGLRDYFELLSLAGTREGDLVTQKDVLRLISKQRELNFPPGERFLYSNSNYALLATIVERVTGESFRDWMARNVFAPLGMTQTQVCDDHQRIIKDRAWSYRSDAAAKGAFKTVVFPYSGYGAGGIYSTVEDLARWLSNVARPRPGDGRVIRQMLEPGRLNNDEPIRYAFALMVDEHRGLKRIGHTGSLAGYRAYLGWFPDQDLGVIVLSNLASFPPGKAMEVAGLFLAEPFNKTIAPKANGNADPAPDAGRPATARPDVQNVETAEQAPALSADDLIDFAGAYSSLEVETTITIAVEQTNLVVKHARIEDVRLAGRGQDRFTGSTPFRLVHFERDAQGRISGLRVSNDRVLGVLFGRQPSSSRSP